MGAGEIDIVVEIFLLLKTFKKLQRISHVYVKQSHYFGRNLNTTAIGRSA